VKNNGSSFPLFQTKQPDRDIAAYEGAVSSARLTYQNRIRQPGAALSFLRGGYAMEGVKLKQPTEQPQIVYIDGCKVTIKYSRQENPLRSRQSVMCLSTASLQKKRDFLHFLLKYEIIMV
jgi:hypothetical protein